MGMKVALREEADRLCHDRRAFSIKETGSLQNPNIRVVIKAESENVLRTRLGLPKTENPELRTASPP
jgi:hypothetical protein